MRGGKTKGLLWTIHLNAHSAPSYIFGTMHSAGAVATGKISQVSPFLRDCTYYFGESDIDQLMSKPFQSVPSEWKGLRQLFSIGSYRKLEGQLKRRFNMDLNAIQHLPPMLLSTWISEKMMAATIQDALDIQIWMLAKEWGLVVQGLESAEEQQIIYAGIPLSFQIRQLKKMLLNLSATGKNLTRIEQAYLRDDLLVLFRLTHRHLGKTKKILLYDRNLVMAQRIFDQIHNRPESSFFAIGAAHLPGQKGVLRYLKHHGLSLVPTVADAEINRI